MTKQKEIRSINLTNIDIQTNENDCILKGYVNKYGTRSQYMGFFEVVEEGAFDNCLNNDILALYGHDYNKPLGRLGSNLKLETDDLGLKFELRINPNVSWAKDTYELVKDGVLQGMSFGFYCNKDSWGYDENGIDVRTIKDLTLYEISVVSSPAYLDSTVSCRSYDLHTQELEKAKELRQRKIKLELELL